MPNDQDRIDFAAQQAIETVIATMKDLLKTGDDRERLAAALFLLNYAYPRNEG